MTLTWKRWQHWRCKCLCAAPAGASWQPAACDSAPAPGSLCVPPDPGSFRIAGGERLHVYVCMVCFGPAPVRGCCVTVCQ